MAGASGEPGAIAAQQRKTAGSNINLIVRISRLLTARRVTAHALLLAVCLWSVYALDLATPGLRDRAGHVKGADFVHFYAAGRLVRSPHSRVIYDPIALSVYQQELVPQSAGAYFVASYGPQVYLAISPLTRLPYEWAALIWALFNCAVYAACCYATWRACPWLQPYAFAVFLLALAYPGFFNLIAFGQSSVPALALFTAAFLALRSRRSFLAGLAIGSLVYKPQLGLAAVFLLAAEWKLVAGALAAAAAQLSLAWVWLGSSLMRQYFRALLRIGNMLPSIEPRLYQIHSVRGFWLLLLPWRSIAAVLYLVSAAAILALAAICWRSRAALSLRYSALLLASVLIAPHLMIYDLVILAPAFLLLGDWAIQHAVSGATPALRIFLYLGYALPLLESLARITRVQLSVIALVVLLALVWTVIQQSTRGLPGSLTPAL